MALFRISLPRSLINHAPPSACRLFPKTQSRLDSTPAQSTFSALPTLEYLDIYILYVRSGRTGKNEVNSFVWCVAGCKPQTTLFGFISPLFLLGQVGSSTFVSWPHIKSVIGPRDASFSPDAGAAAKRGSILDTY
jgi:hypothetical protein